MCILKKYIILSNLFISLISFGQTPITKDERIREIEIVKASWTSLHPGLMRYNTSSQIDQNLASKDSNHNLRPTKFSLRYLKQVIIIHLQFNLITYQ